MLLALGRLLVRLLSLVLLVVLALVGLAAAVFCLQGGTETLALPHGAELARLPAVRDWLAGVLDGLEASGSTAVAGLAAGLGAMALGALLLAGLLVPRRERMVVLAHDDGTIAARRRPLAQAARVLAEQTRGVTRARTRVRPGRRRGGVLRVRADRPRSSDPGEVERALEERLAALATPFELRTAITVRLGGRGSRVE